MEFLFLIKDFGLTSKCILNRGLVKNLLVNQKRFSVRESIHKFREPHKFKKHMLAACQPYIRRKYLTDEETCKVSQQLNRPIELHPLEKILINELLDDIRNSEFVLFIQHNYTKFQSERVYKNTITKSGGKFQALNNNIYRETFKILGHDNLLPLFITRNALVTGNCDQLPACLTVLRKMPQFLLLLGLVNNHLCDVDQLRAISLVNNIDQARVNLLSLLNTPSIDLSYNLQQHCESIDKNKE